MQYNTYKTVDERIANGQDNANLFIDVQQTIVHADPNSYRMSVLHRNIFHAVFKAMNSRTLNKKQVNNYELFLKKSSKWLNPGFDEMFSSFISELFVDLRNENSYRLMSKLLPIYFRRFDINKTCNKSNMNLLHSACESKIDNMDLFIDGLVRWCGADVHVRCGDHGKALHLVTDLTSPEKAIKKIEALMAHGLDLCEEINYQPLTFNVRDRCINYMDFLDKQAAAMSQPQMLGTVVSKNAFELRRAVTLLVQSKVASEVAGPLVVNTRNHRRSAL